MSNPKKKHQSVFYFYCCHVNFGWSKLNHSQTFPTIKRHL